MRLLLTAWIGVPLVLGVLSLGCAQALEQISRVRVARALLLPLGLAVVIVLAQALTVVGVTAKVAAPVVVVTAITGLVMGRRTLRRVAGPWLIAAIVVYLAYGAPVLASGGATFAGYRALDDTASWLALIDHVMSNGRSIEGLTPSAFEATLAAYLPNGYPLGGFLALGVTHQLLGTDSMWLYHPFLAYAGAMLALALYELCRRFVSRPAAAVAVASIAAQPATLYAYAMWGGIKEMVAAAMLPLVAAIAGERRSSPRDWLGMLPLAVACSALLATLSVGAIIWIVPLVLPALLVGAQATRRAPWRALALRHIGSLAVLGAICSAPVIALAVTFLRPLFQGGPGGGGVFASEREIGTLLQRLDLRQLVGIWPTDDFRLAASHIVLVDALIAVAVALAALGIVLAWRRGAYGLVAYVLGAVVISLAIRTHSSPWADGKSLAQSSPAILLAALSVVAVRWDRRALRPLGWGAGALLAAGVLWSNALTYGGTNLAPREQLSELSQIAAMTPGRGPTLFSDGGVVGPVHILRAADAEGVSEARRDQFLLRDGSPLPGATQIDIDELDQNAVWAYRSLVLRRAPDASRPLGPYRLRWSGRYYELWERAPDATIPGGHLTLGSEKEHEAGTVPRCDAVMRLARAAGPTGRLATVVRRSPTVIGLDDGPLPAGWAATGFPAGRVIPDRGGTIERTFSVGASGRLQVWLNGSTRARTTLLVDGREIGSARHVLNWANRSIPFGEVQLDRGRHRLTVRYDDGGPQPGDRKQRVKPYYFGPVILSQETAARPVVTVPSARARTLCGQRLDWIEVLPG